MNPTKTKAMIYFGHAASQSMSPCGYACQYDKSLPTSRDAISSQTRHHSKIHPVTTAPTYTDLRQLDWSYLVPATIIPHKGEGLSVAFHELDAQQRNSPWNLRNSSSMWTPYQRCLGNCCTMYDSFLVVNVL
jgi:hypothetical protein